MNELKKLIDVKSIVTLTLTLTFSFLCIKNNMLKEMLSIYTMIMGFYFGTQSQKNENAKAENNKENAQESLEK